MIPFMTPCIVRRTVPSKIALALALVCALGAQPAFACGCDIDCPPGEHYSDAEEMCVATEDSVS